jgi:hypothetical protein
VDLQEAANGAMNWNDLAQVRNRWQAVVNVVMKIQVL